VGLRCLTGTTQCGRKRFGGGGLILNGTKVEKPSLKDSENKREGQFILPQGTREYSKIEKSQHEDCEEDSSERDSKRERDLGSSRTSARGALRGLVLGNRRQKTKGVKKKKIKKESASSEGTPQGAHPSPKIISETGGRRGCTGRMEERFNLYRGEWRREFSCPGTRKKETNGEEQREACFLQARSVHEHVETGAMFD